MYAIISKCNIFNCCAGTQSYVWIQSCVQRKVFCKNSERGEFNILRDRSITIRMSVVVVRDTIINIVRGGPITFVRILCCKLTNRWVGLDCKFWKLLLAIFNQCHLMEFLLILDVKSDIFLFFRYLFEMKRNWTEK